MLAWGAAGAPRGSVLALGLDRGPHGPDNAGLTVLSRAVAASSLTLPLPQTQAPGRPPWRSAWPRRPWKPCSWRSGSASSPTPAGRAVEVGPGLGCEGGAAALGPRPPFTPSSKLWFIYSFPQWINQKRGAGLEFLPTHWRCGRMRLWLPHLRPDRRLKGAGCWEQRPLGCCSSPGGGRMERAGSPSRGREAGVGGGMGGPALGSPGPEPGLCGPSVL